SAKTPQRRPCPLDGAGALPLRTWARTSCTTLRMSSSVPCMVCDSRSRRLQPATATQAEACGYAHQPCAEKIVLFSTLTVSTIPTMVQSTGSFSVSGVRRALEPWTISTVSPWPAPTVSTTTKLRPVPTSRSRAAGSTRNGSTINSLCPVIDRTFCVATTLPVTTARNIRASRLGQFGGELVQDLLLRGESARVELAEGRLAADEHVEDAAAARRRRNLDRVAVSLPDRVRQTGGSPPVASGRAIRNVDRHDFPPL